MIPDQYIIKEDWSHWLREDHWSEVVYKRMKNGYSVEILFENEFLERYWEEVKWAKTIHNNLKIWTQI